MKAEATPEIIGKRVFRTPGPREDWEHFISCNGCGKPLDMRRLDKLLAHEAHCLRE